MPLAREGVREMLLATVVCGAGVALAIWWWWPVATPFVLVWGWAISFFRDPPRRGDFAAGELCAAADGVVTEISMLERDELIGGPAIRVGQFLSIFDVHINRAPCSGTVRSVAYKPGAFLDARHPESGRRNESMTIVIDPDEPLPGPIVVRQVAGLVARRIVCHLKPGDRVATGERFGLIKFGSRTELIVPEVEGVEVVAEMQTHYKAGTAVMVRVRKQ